MADKLVILRKKRRNGTLRNLIFGATVYDTVSTRTVLPLQKIKTAEREIKSHRMVRIPKVPGENDSYRLDPESFSSIYLTTIIEVGCCAVAANRRKQGEAKKNAAYKKAACVTKRGSSFKKLFSPAANLPSNTITTKDHTDSVLQAILPLSTNTIIDASFHLGGKIGELPDFKKQTVAAEITRRWGQHIVGHCSFRVGKIDLEEREGLIFKCSSNSTLNV